MAAKTYRTGSNSVDAWSNTAKDGSGQFLIPIVDASGHQKIQFGAITVGQLTRGNISISTLNDNTVITGVSGQTIRVFKLFMVTTLAANITFKDGASTSLSGAIPLLANGSIVLEFDGEPWFVTSAGNNFVINLSVGTLNAGAIYYTQS